MIYINMTAPLILLVGTVVAFAVTMWVGLSKRRFTTRSLILAIVLTAALTAVSFIINDKDMSGTGWRHH